MGGSSSSTTHNQDGGDAVPPRAYKYELLGTLRKSGLDLVAYVVDRDFQNAKQYVEREDLIGYGVFGLLRASEEYDSSKGVSFATFACKNIQRAIINFIRQKCQRKYRYLEEIEDYRGGVSPPLQNEYDDEDEKAYVRHAVNSLPGRYRSFAEKYYLEEMSVKEFRKASSMKRYEVFRLRKQTIALLRLAMVNPDRV